MFGGGVLELIQNKANWKKVCGPCERLELYSDSQSPFFFFFKKI